jgi:cellulose synthase/poly-beta-1,6-N-acetylglucosamine synthase-like glycosyltransferase
MVKILRRKDKTGFKPGNLNDMLRHSKGEIIVIFDSDFAPERDFLKRIVTPFIYDKKISAVQARWKFTNPSQNIVTALASTIVYTFHHVTLSLMKKYDSGFLCGSAEAVRRRELVKDGGWKSGSLTEDIEYSLRIHKNGRKIHYLPALECFNEVPSKPLDLYRQQMRWAHGVISSYKMHSWDLLSTHNLKGKNRLLTFLGAFGYLIPIIILITFVAGIFSILTHRPAPMEWGKFLSELFRNTMLTSGLIIASSISLFRAKKMRLWPKMLMASFSIGLLTTYYVNIGILKALFNKPMEWYLLSKSQG